jgi:hypothetical protein
MWYLCVGQDRGEIIESGNVPLMVDRGGVWYGISCGYATKDALISGCKILDEPCVVCGSPVATKYNDCAEQLIAKNMCFSCNIWDIRATSVGPEHMIYNHMWYTVRDDNPTSCFRGHGGRKFTFIRNGAMVVSKNVWYGGRIPKHFRSKIPNNAFLI